MPGTAGVLGGVGTHFDQHQTRIQVVYQVVVMNDHNDYRVSLENLNSVFALLLGLKSKCSQ